MIKKKECEEDLDDSLNELNEIEIDEIIEDLDIEESEIDTEDSEDSDSDVWFNFNTNNHKLEGKHSLTRDTIFKGKIDDSSEDNVSSGNSEIFNMNEGFTLETGSMFDFESRNNEEYIGRLNLQNDVYELLKEKTELDFSSNRRKPNRQAFNDYYKMLLNNIGKEYTKSEIFVELSYYFTDNIFNMFKLLDKEYATQIIVELKKSGYLNNLNNINFI